MLESIIALIGAEVNIAICTVLAGRFPARTMRELETALAARYREIFNAKLTVIWLEVPPEQAFTNGRPSTMSWLLIPTPATTDQDTRERALTTLADDWARIADVNPHDVMIAMPDPSTHATYLAANRQRIPVHRLPEFLLRNGIRVASRIATRRVLATTANF